MGLESTELSYELTFPATGKLFRLWSLFFHEYPLRLFSVVLHVPIVYLSFTKYSF